MQQQKKQQMQLTRSLSAGSTPQDGINIPDHMNVPRRRDSGNWSGDRNSASSSSSTTMDNPYLYIVNKMQRNSGVPKSPTSKSGELSSSSSGHYDAGYDSYSLSSTDSLPLQQGLKHNLQVNEECYIGEKIIFCKLLSCILFFHLVHVIYTNIVLHSLLKYRKVINLPPAMIAKDCARKRTRCWINPVLQKMPAILAQPWHYAAQLAVKPEPRWTLRIIILIRSRQLG